MEVTLKFNMTIDKEIELYKTYIKAEDMCLALYDILSLLRGILKYDTDFSPTTYSVVKKIQADIIKITDGYDLRHIINH